MATLVAIPSVNPGGLEAALMPHFGHCDVFTLVTVEDGAVKEVATLPNMPHDSGGCTTPVQHLADRGVSVMLAGGMGIRPLEVFLQSGIQVLYAGTAGTVSQAVSGYTQGLLPHFGDNGLCKGDCGHH